MRRFKDLPRLTRDEEQKLAGIIQTGLRSEDPEEIREGIDAYHELVEGNINMVISWAMKYHYTENGRVNQTDDFVQVALVALCESALKYQPGPVGFGVFCKKLVTNSMTKDRARNAYCLSMNDMYFKEIQQIKSRKEGTGEGRPPLLTDDEAITKLEIIGSGAIYLDQELGNGEDGGTIGDIIPDPQAYVESEPDDNPEKQEQLQQLHRALDQLTEYELLLIHLRYGFDSEELSYAEIGKRLGGVKHSTMQKRVQNVERKIRKIIGFENWKDLPYIKPRLYLRKKHEGNC